MRGAGRRALLVVGAAYVAALAWAAVVLPDRVPTHFDAAGRVDEWSSRTALMVTWVVLGVVVLAGIPALTRALTAGDGTWVNMPQASKDYWFAPERRAEFAVRFQDDMEAVTALTGALLVAALVLTTRVGVTGRDGAPSWAFPVLVGGYLVLTALWTVRLLRAYRPPVQTG
ncbi:DUF1648 domain-containing protein [Nocardioides sp. zg-1228]|uniref:DUF1648 domain-containing protein n=1 Tax=Nocardioides sp. zg-1228 TaxID=2763008 RepID=UPI001642981B|nr:DUF1648 domain-containing protein [Nocardioides sp. zg-1228]MBC2931807.1 DUF1648 domain-containing protein [Nocardioides sp. zg-1228]QSF57380.1 DUF1648 domain-containing protein [Nocardioides sp. zg-1228]